MAGYAAPAPITVSVQAGGETDVVGAYTLADPPAITSPLASTAILGQAYSYQIAATLEPTSFSATGLPAGLSLNGATGAISGKPSVAGSFNISLQAQNTKGKSSAVTLHLTVEFPGTLNVAINATGKCSVSPKSLLGESVRGVGSIISLTAMPASGYLFDSWVNADTGQKLSSQATYAFIMPESMSLQANFVVNPFLSCAGSYFGLLQGGDFNDSGTIQITLSRTGAFTGAIALGAATGHMKNSFTDDGAYTGPVILSDNRAYVVTANLSALGGLTGALTGLTGSCNASNGIGMKGRIGYGVGAIERTPDHGIPSPLQS